MEKKKDRLMSFLVTAVTTVIVVAALTALIFVLPNVISRYNNEKELKNWPAPTTENTLTIEKYASIIRTQNQNPVQLKQQLETYKYFKGKVSSFGSLEGTQDNFFLRCFDGDSRVSIGVYLSEEDIKDLEIGDEFMIYFNWDKIYSSHSDLDYLYIGSSITSRYIGSYQAATRYYPSK